tara:strand:+ start:631 stop:1191 length:561 start_codon:yes stop_codon:yes gene_type:complete
MADGILKVGTITTSSGSGTITLGQSGETVDMANGTITLNSSMQNTPAFLAFNSSAQTLSHNTSTKIVFDLEKFDTDNAFASNTFTVPSGKAGKYLFSWGVNYFNAGAQITAALLNVKVNNSTFVEGWQNKPAYTEDFKLGSTVLDLSAGNTVDLYYYITTGNSSSSTIRSGGTSSYHTFFSGYKLI